VDFVNKSELREIEDLVGEFDTAMLVTRSLEGKLHARPMAIAGHAANGEIYFATRAEDEKVAEILSSHDVAVTLQGTGRYLAISGSAQPIESRALAEELWSPEMRLWFPNGPSDPHFIAIRVAVRYAEYWDRTGFRKLEFLWEAGKAVLKGQKAQDDQLSGHGRVRMQTRPDSETS
jgi:general stress protein 26